MRSRTLLLLAACAATGCRESPARTGSAIAARSPLRNAAVAHADIIAAVHEAYALQNTYWDSLGGHGEPAHRASREAILAHYRQRFGDSLAMEYTKYALEGAPEKIMDTPDSVAVLRVSGDVAEVAYPTPLPLKEIWGRADYTIDQLRRTDGRWKIVASHGSASRPPGVTAPPT